MCNCVGRPVRATSCPDIVWRSPLRMRHTRGSRTLDTHRYKPAAHRRGSRRYCRNYHCQSCHCRRTGNARWQGRVVPPHPRYFCCCWQWPVCCWPWVGSPGQQAVRSRLISGRRLQPDCQSWARQPHHRLSSCSRLQRLLRSSVRRPRRLPPRCDYAARPAAGAGIAAVLRLTGIAVAGGIGIPRAVQRAGGADLGPHGALEGAEPAGQVEGAVAGDAGAHARHLLLDPRLVFYAARLVRPRAILLTLGDIVPPTCADYQACVTRVGF